MQSKTKTNKTMKQKEIIERLILEVQVLHEQIGDYDNENQFNDILEFVNLLIKRGYKNFPEYKNQSMEDIQEIQRLIKLTP